MPVRRRVCRGSRPTRRGRTRSVSHQCRRCSRLGRSSGYAPLGFDRIAESVPVQGAMQTRSRAALVVAEFALALPLLMGVGTSWFNSFLRLQRVNPGFKTRGRIRAPALASIRALHGPAEL